MKVEKSSQELEVEVIYAGKCTQCGSCNAFCPHMEFSSLTGEACVVDECSETVGLCYNACPRTFLPISEIEQKLFDQTRTDFAIGVFKEIIQVKSKNNDDILYNLVTAAFDTGIIKHLVVGESNSKKTPRNIPKVVDSASDAKSLIPKTTMDNTGPLITGIGEAYRDYKRDIGIIGNPCHIQGLAKILTSDFNTGAEKTSLRIAFACSSGGTRGCKYCTDFSGEFSDITYSNRGNQKGEAFLIIRSDVGQNVVNAAKEKGLLEVTNTSPDLSEMRKYLNRKRKRNFKTLNSRNLISADYLVLNFDELKDFLEEEDPLQKDEYLFY
jgi:coenzyme F420-reducing hydrogenase beta subunit